MSNLIDMTGWIMKEHNIPDSKWTVLYYIGKSKWHCKCECGNEKDIDGKTLRNGMSKSCGQCRMYSHNTINEIGNIYGRLTVIEDGDKSTDGHKLWRCKCECGNIITVLGKDLRNNHTQSCGCLRKDILRERRLASLEGQRFGKLLVLQSNGVKNNNQYWKCKCDCGNIVFVSTHNLTSGNTKSCGCIKSYGEQKIQEILDKLKYQYIKEYSFDDLKFIYPLRFDFAIFQNDDLICLIEYQGIQHYDNNNNNWHRGETDEVKRIYCKNHNIKLVEIPYFDYNKLNDKYLKELIDEGNYSE